MLQSVSDDPIYLFNPTGFVMDEAGGNWNSLKIVYGNDAVSRAVSCEFHFKQSVGRKSGKLSNDLSKEKFESLAYSLLQANTPSVFEKRRTEMNHFIKENPEERGCLRDWVKWWEARKSHIFRAFKGTSKTPHMNLAETGHSTWAKSGACNLTLVDAARHDVGENIRLEKLLQGFLDGSIRPTGKGPSITKRANTEYSAQMKRAKEYGNEILQAEFNGDPYTVDEADCPIDPLGSNTPTTRGRRKGSKKSKKDATDLPTCLAQTIPTDHKPCQHKHQHKH